MKNYPTLLFLLLILSTSVFGQTNTFPTSGNVGIGILNPNSPLHINSNSTGVTSIFGHGSDGGFRIVSTQSRISNADGALIGEFGIDYNGIKNSAIAFYRGNTVTGGFMAFTTNDGTERMRIANTGNIGIGTFNPTQKLEVNGNIKTKEVNVTAAGWPDYVFAPDYHLISLDSLSDYIHANKHLPDVPSEKAVLENGVNVGEMNATLLKKIEELTLYMIKQDEEMKSLKASNEEIREELKALAKNPKKRK